MNILDDIQVTLTRLEVLPEGDDIHAGILPVAQDFDHFIFCFAKAEHDAGFGVDGWSDFLDSPEEVNRAHILGLWPNSSIEAWNGFRVVVEDIRMCAAHDFDCKASSPEVGREHFDAGVGALDTQGLDDGCDVACTAIVDIIPVYTRHDDVLESEVCCCICDASRLIGFKRCPPTGFDGAKPAGARAGIAHHHECRGAFGPAFPKVWTTGFFTDSDQPPGTHQVFDPVCIP